MAVSDIVLRVDDVSKKFVRGEIHDSLRDLVPAALARLTGRNSASSAKRDFWALQNVSFELTRGEAFGIVGANGAGKSTILKLISGVMSPTSGKIEVNGKLSALIEVGAGFHPDLTGRENVYLNGAILGMTRAETAEKFDSIVEFSGLADFIDTPVKRYSTGMYARLGFAVAAHVDPDILIVDEVLSVGDFVFQNRCLERMNTIIRGGASVIFVSHNLRAIAELCPRSVLLERGQIVENGPSSHVIKTYLERTGALGGNSGSSVVRVVKPKVRGADHDNVAFDSGEKIYVDVEVECSGASEPFSVVLLISDDRQYEIFHTSTEYLGYPPITMKEGERFACSFEMDLNLAGGTYYLGVVLFRFNNEKVLDRLYPAATIFVNSSPGAHGVVNTYPKVTVFGPVGEQMERAR